MAKTNRPRRRMDRYFKDLERNPYILSYNKKGSCTTKTKKWDVIRKLTKKIIAEDEQSGKLHEELRNDSSVQLLPRQNVMLYGTIPMMEPRVYSKCKHCNRVFNPRDILSHRNCSRSHAPHPSLLKKWDVIRKLTKKFIAEDEQSAKPHQELRNDSGVHLLPRQNVMLYGTIPVMEQKVYSKCKNCSRVFNPRDILSHKNCSKPHAPHTNSLEKKVKDKNVNAEKLSSNGSPTSNSTNSDSSSLRTSFLTTPLQDPDQDSLLKRRFTPPALKAAAVAVTSSAESAPMFNLIISVTKIGISKVSQSASITSSTHTTTATTSSDKSDGKLFSSKKTINMNCENDSTKALTSRYLSRAKNMENSQDNLVGTVPVAIMPVSSVAVVSSVQLLQIGNKIISLEAPESATSPPVKKQIILPVQTNHSNGITMYKSHPKPIILPNFETKDWEEFYREEIMESTY